ncbi:hypothetical protein BBP40_007362 [Aspergillus hancockii]|nr:hypothetical protein BBP40_007362 [Aspergillus hancockii]
MEFTISLPTTASRTLPKGSAPAEEVRSYTTQLLVKKYDVPIDIAEKYASKWEIGRFSQLTSASRETLQRIFGDNVGLCVYSALREDISKILDEKPSVIISGYAATTSALVLVSVLLLFFLPELGLQAKQDRVTWAASPVWWFLFAVSGIFHAIKHPLRIVLLLAQN